MPCIRAKSQYAFELGERDHDGQSVSRDRQTHFIVRVPIHVSSADKEVAVAFYVRGKVPKATVEGISDLLVRSFSVAAAVAKSASQFPPRCREWTLYGSTEIGVTEPVEGGAISTPSLSVEVEVFPELAEVLRAETKLRREVKIAFEKAKEFLLRDMRYTGARNEIRSAAQFIEACRDREVWSGPARRTRPGPAAPARCLYK
jgi:hypothetical protein